MFFAWAHVFFFPFHKPNYYECAFFLAKPTTHARVVRHTILKRNGKKKPWAQTNNSLPNNHVRHNEASFNSTKWRCPYDNVTYCKFTPNRKQLPKQLPPPLHMARTWMDMHSSDGSMTVNISWKTHLQMKIQTYQIYFTTIYIGKGRKPQGAKHRRVFMPICLASLPILPGSAAGAAALKYIYIYILGGCYKCLWTACPGVTHWFQEVKHEDAGCGEVENHQWGM